MINPVDSPALVGAPVSTPQGTQLGTIDSVRVDPGSGWFPRWASVQTTEGTTLIPLAHATLTAGGAFSRRPGGRCPIRRPARR